MSLHINDLPHQLLVDILLRLSWREKLKIERVCWAWNGLAKGNCWSQYRCFNNTEFKLDDDAQASKTRHLLSRCGRFLHTFALALSFCRYHYLDASVVASLLSLCPNVRHLRIERCELNTKAVDCIRSGMARSLLSLELVETIGGGVEVPGMAITLDRLLYRLFHDCDRLEYLTIERIETEDPRSSCYQLQLPPALCHLSIRVAGHPVLTEANAYALAGSLRALELFHGWRDGQTFPQLGCLKHWGEGLTYLSLPRLVSLGVNLALPANMINATSVARDQFLAALPQMTQLRALELHATDVDTVVAVARDCPLLEHLTLSAFDNINNNYDDRRFVKAILSMDRLISLKLDDSGWGEPGEALLCRLIDAKPGMEWLQLYTYDIILPTAVVCKLIRGGRNLHCISLLQADRCYKEADYEAFVAASEARWARWGASNSTNGDEQPALPLIIHIWDVGMQTRDDECQPPLKLKENPDIGLCVVYDTSSIGSDICPTFETIESHVLQRHRYAALTEGAPLWKPKWGDKNNVDVLS